MQELFLICGNKEALGSFLPSYSLTSLALVTRSPLSAARSIQAPRPWLHPGFFFCLFMAQHGSQPQVPSDPSLKLSSKETDPGQLSNSWANSSV